MKIELDGDIKIQLLKVAKLAKISPDLVLEHAFVLSVHISQLPREQREIVEQWLEDCRRKNEH